MNFTELTDPDGDALTFTSDRSGTWITCSSGSEEVTVGPFPTGELSAVLAAARATEARSSGAPQSWAVAHEEPL